MGVQREQEVTGSEPWERLVDAENHYFTERRRLFASGALDQLRLALGSVRGIGCALRVLRDAPVELVLDLIDPLFDVATRTHADVGLARLVIARADPGWLSQALRPLVSEFLDRADLDDSDYRRLAELLDSLHQSDLMELLVLTADRSTDEDIREVADDFRDRIGLSSLDRREI